ncbi:MAG TPA: sigma factor [Bryobacteraceae bacterium]|nr:sigma factor [Bryobacteraceae bacterium]
MDRRQQGALYEEANSLCRRLPGRLARAYEADPDRRSDLLQEMHVELWRSMASFDHRCSLRTWVYRVVHNVGASHVIRSRRAAERLVALETLDVEIASVDPPGTQTTLPPRRPSVEGEKSGDVHRYCDPGNQEC